MLKNTVRSLKDEIKELIPQKTQQFNLFRKKFKDVKIDTITVNSILSGMRGNKSMFWQGTTLDPIEGIRFNNFTLSQCQTSLPGLNQNNHSNIFLPESMLWFLMTGGKIPTLQQSLQLSNDLSERTKNGNLPPNVNNILSQLPKKMHPMTQLSIGLLLLQENSFFQKNYENGTLNKDTYWEDTLEDSLNLIAMMPLLAGKIYSNMINEGKPLGQFNPSKDWSYNICSLIGINKNSDSSNISNLSNRQLEDFVNLMRLYLGIHVDHEGGNVSAHSTHLVGSALTDPYLSYSSGINGLAGPLHGLAAQEVVRFLIEMNSNISSPKNLLEIENYLWNLLSCKRVIPGYGHAVLRNTDPRFTSLLNFVHERSQEFANDSHVQLMQNLTKVAPKVLTEHGKCQNPYPNVDSASGILFYHYGLKQTLFMTVIFACSRAIGPLSQLVWDRIYGLPIERPKSLDLNSLKKLVTSP
ncbi:hypothetical protein KAFR_0B01850 [Kazachstania africana CBS 2517]|uniref:Citrate synthase n=1 Tax=Kazachstania africana (strain ATCC 22294 / BCRC 22015 / CBS 2517 / CECT 1963 / NBRC 1671 / NRRL Y-8276) TaxID=1071382 RepID=H2AQ34_KAZAF|nr:hypothetical protein KAFR_0B01850 [Kazachstania africana CBS 2517]CCF56484.1 hypothetical protein KAFR_0B01850 [Kazachstania africana CBS 2517]